MIQSGVPDLERRRCQRDYCDLAALRFRGPRDTAHPNGTTRRKVGKQATRSFSEPDLIAVPDAYSTFRSHPRMPSTLIPPSSSVSMSDWNLVSESPARGEVGAVTCCCNPPVPQFTNEFSPLFFLQKRNQKDVGNAGFFVCHYRTYLCCVSPVSSIYREDQRQLSFVTTPALLCNQHSTDR